MLQQSSRSFPSAGALSAVSSSSGSVPRPDLGSDPAGAEQWGPEMPVFSSPAAPWHITPPLQPELRLFSAIFEIIEWEFNRSLSGTGRMAQKNQQLMIWYQFALH